jgi:hypothetical protein
MGFSSFIFDYRGYGLSEGKPSESGTYLDAEAAWTWVANNVEATSGGSLPILIMGRSLGGPISARLAANHPPAALVLDSTFPSLRALIRLRAPLLPTRFVLRFDYDTLVPLLGAGFPVLVVHSRDDKTVPLVLGRELFSSLRTPKDFLEIDGPHIQGFTADPEGYMKGLDNFLRRYVPDIPRE